MNINKEIQLTANYFDIHPECINVKAGRRGKYVKARKFIIQYLAFKSPKKFDTLTVGKMLGYKDHSSYIYHRDTFYDKRELPEYYEFMAKNNGHTEVKSLDVDYVVKNALNAQLEFMKKALERNKGKVINETLIDKIIG